MNRRKGHDWLSPHILLCIALTLFILSGCTSSTGNNATNSSNNTQSSGYNTYTTTFSLTQNPISENGAWLNGKTDGIDWSDVRTGSGSAYGTQVPPTGPPYNDSIAVLKGTWKPDQKVAATVHTLNQTEFAFEEVELFLRGSIAAHNTTGYEVNFRCLTGPNTYVQINYWNGPLNSYGGLNSTVGPGLHDGDVVSASIVGNTITVWINGAQVLQAQDSLNRFPAGNPGMGFYYQGSGGSDSDYGFTSYSATDQI